MRVWMVFLMFMVASVAASVGEVRAEPPTPPRSAGATEKAAIRVDASALRGFAGGCVRLMRASTGEVWEVGDACATRLPPCSTFKIPNALIALDAGAVSGADHVERWDGVKRAFKVWDQDHTLASAMRHSVVWYFQRLATRTGAARMQRDLVRLGYGNRNSSAGLTVFWLGRSLTISAQEQLTFIDALRRGALPMSARAQAIVRELIVQERHGHNVLRGKTGTRFNDQWKAPDLGWFVGYTEHHGEAWVFTVNLLGKGASGTIARERALEVLRGVGAWPHDAGRRAAR